MPILKGNITGSIAGIPYDIPSTITSYYLTNMTGGSITVTLGISNNNTGELVHLFNTTIAANATERSDVPILMLSGWTVYISTSGSLDYYISIA